MKNYYSIIQHHLTNNLQSKLLTAKPKLSPIDKLLLLLAIIFIPNT